MRQVKLQHKNIIYHCWIENKKDIKIGDEVTLKGEEMNPWTILRMTVNHEENPNRTWKVGGL